MHEDESECESDGEGRGSAVLRFLKGLASPMSDDNILELSPWKRFVRYGKLPWVIIVELMLAAAITIFVHLHAVSRTSHVNEGTYTFVNTFLPEGFEPMQHNIDGYNTAYFSTTGKTVQTLWSIVQKYYSLPESNPDTMAFSSDGPSITMTTNFYKGNLRDFLTGGHAMSNGNFVTPMSTIPQLMINFFPSLENHVEKLTLENPLGEFFSRNESELRHVFDKLHDVKLEMKVLGADTSDASDTYRNWLQYDSWSIQFTLDHSTRSGSLPLAFSVFLGEYDGPSFWLELTKPVTWCALAVFVLSLISFVINCNSLFRRVRIFVKRRRKDKSITFSRFNEFVDLWYVPVMAKDVCGATGTLLFFISPAYTESAYPILIGFGAILSFLSLVRFFKFLEKFYVLVLALRLAMPDFIRFFLSVFPIFMGFTLTGTLFFGQISTYFLTIDMTAVTLFGLMNGDEMIGIFAKLYAYGDWTRHLGRVYLYVFASLFVLSILNIFLLIMEKAYFSLIGEYHEKEKEKKLKLEEDEINFELQENRETLTAGLLENEIVPIGGGGGEEEEKNDSNAESQSREDLVESITKSIIIKFKRKHLGHITKEQHDTIMQIGDTVGFMVRVHESQVSVIHSDNNEAA